ncbi:MAG: TetR/AcrR family transcriptional regulator [Pseudolabrys sp.]
MARKSSKRPSNTQAAAKPAPSRNGSNREKATAALMTLLAEQPFERIGLAEIAGEAKLSLSELRAEFGSTLAILAAHIKEIDRAVLSGTDDKDTDLSEDPARERLFEVLMRRLEALAPYKEAVRSLLRSARRNPGLAIALNGMAMRSQQWMLTAAGIGTAGARGAIRAQGAALLFARVVAVWVDDDEPGLDRTMAALDHGLASGERWAGFVDDLFCIPAAICRGPRRRRRPADEGAAEADAA